MDLQGPPGVKGDAGNNHNQGERGRGGEQGRAPSDRGILWFKKYPTFSISQNLIEKLTNVVRKLIIS